MNSSRFRIGVLLFVIVALPCAVTAADDPLANVGQLLFAGKVAEARAEIEKGRQKSVAERDAPGEAVSYLLLGLADVGLNKPADARVDLERSSVKFTALGDQFGAWMSLWTLAELERREGQFDVAIAAHERALALLREATASDARFSAESMKALAPVFGMPAEAVAPLVANPEMFKPILLRLAELMARDSYGTTLIETGALEKADEQLTRAAELSSLFFGLLDGPIAAHIGDLRRRQWRFEDARKSYLKALEGNKNLPNVPVRDAWVEVDILGKLADLEILSGQVNAALAWNDRAIKIVRGSSNPKREVSTLADRGNLLLRAGRLDAAEAVFTEALRLATQNHDDSERASIFADLGALHMFAGAYGTAVSQFEKSLEIYQTLNEPYVEAPIWITLAEVYLLLEDRDSARVALDKARDLAKKSHFTLASSLVDVLVAGSKTAPGQLTPEVIGEAFATVSAMPEAGGLMMGAEAPRVLRELLALNSGAKSVDPGPVSPATPPVFRGIALMLKGKFLLDRGDFAGARAAWSEALSTNPSRDHRAGYLALIGTSYWKEGNRTDAVKYFEQAAQTLESVAADIKVEEMLAGYLGSNRHIYYDVLVDMLVQQGRVKEAFEQAERSRARAFLQIIGNHRLNAERSGDPVLVREAEMLRTQIGAWEKQANQTAPSDAPRIASDLKFARQRYTSLQTRIKASNPEYSALTIVEPLNLDDIRADLPADTTLISYFVTVNGTHAWVVDRTELHHVALPVDAAGLQRIVCWASHFAPARDLRGAERTPNKCTAAATADEAFAKLIAPLREHIHNNRLLLVPHNVLHYVPFAALHDGGSNRYLIEDYTLSYIPSASALRFLRSKETPVNGAALVLGNPSSALPGAPRIRGAEQEAVTVAGLLGSRAVLGPEARESLLYGLGGKVDLVHIASHAIYDPVNPLFSRIALAPGDGYDGNVEVHEILSDVDLSGVNLVVLSACETAVGERSGGDEVVGLTRALLYAGTPGVISTLWKIDDTSSARLMDEFYRRFAAGKLAADALREAQLAIYHSDHYADPKYWAAFTVSGNPQGRWTAPIP
jgi:CHAT domain-containing protein/Flp pilus assembly protein TadD